MNIGHVGFGGGRGGVDSFLKLTDTPSSFNRRKHGVLVVNTDENSVEFTDSLQDISSIQFKDLSEAPAYNSSVFLYNGRPFMKRGDLYAPLRLAEFFRSTDSTLYNFYFGISLTSFSDNGTTATDNGTNVIYLDATRIYPYRRFNGTNAYLELKDTKPDFSNGLTIIGLARWRKLGNWARVIDFGVGQKNNNIIIANENTTSTLVFNVYKNDLEGTRIRIENAIVTGQWIAFAVLQKPGSDTSRTLFIVMREDGKALYQNGYTYVPLKKKRKNYIGKSHWATNDYFNGDLAFFGMWNKALPREEVYEATSALLRLV